MANRRGRPKSAVNQIFENLPEYIKNLTPAKRQEASLFNLDDMERVNKEILKKYKINQSVPDLHAYDMASLGDEAMDGFNESVISKNKQYKVAIRVYRTRGGKKTQKNSITRGDEIFRKNYVLISKIGKIKAYNRKTVSERIYNEWDRVESLLPGEPEALKARGDADQGNKKAAFITIWRWINARL